MRLSGPMVSVGFAMTLATCDSSLAQTPTAQPAPSGRATGVAIPAPVPSATAPVPAYDRKGRRDPFQPIEIGADSVVFSVPPRRGSTPDRIVLRLPDD